MNKEWITDRLPTAEDSLGGKNIVVPDSGPYGWTIRRFETIMEGEPWIPCPTMPSYTPKKTVEEMARESVPDGYSFYEGDYGSPLPKGTLLFSEGLRLFRSRLPHNEGVSGQKSYFYAIPKPRYWEKPSDFPPVCWIMWTGETTIPRRCAMILSLSHKEFSYSNSIGRVLSLPIGDIREYRWSDRPFDTLEDGQECLVEGGSNE